MLAEQGSQAGLESRVQASPDQQAEQAVQELESQGSQEPGFDSAAQVAKDANAPHPRSVQESEPGSQGTEWAQAEPDPPQS